MEGLIKGTSHLAIGQEAIGAAVSVAMRDDQWTFATYRGHARSRPRPAPEDLAMPTVDRIAETVR